MELLLQKTKKSISCDEDFSPQLLEISLLKSRKSPVQFGVPFISRLFSSLDLLTETRFLLFLQYTVPLLEVIISHAQHSIIIEEINSWFDAVYSHSLALENQLRDDARKKGEEFEEFLSRFSCCCLTIVTDPNSNECKLDILLEQFISDPLFVLLHLQNSFFFRLFAQYLQLHPSYFYDCILANLISPCSNNLTKPLSLLTLLGHLFSSTLPSTSFSAELFFHSPLWQTITQILCGETVFSLSTKEEDKTLITIGLWLVAVLIPRSLKCLSIEEQHFDSFFQILKSGFNFVSQEIDLHFCNSPQEMMQGSDLLKYRLPEIFFIHHDVAPSIPKKSHFTYQLVNLQSSSSKSNDASTEYRKLNSSSTVDDLDCKNAGSDDKILLNSLKSDDNRSAQEEPNSVVIASCYKDLNPANISTATTSQTSKEDSMYKIVIRINKEVDSKVDFQFFPPKGVIWRLCAFEIFLGSTPMYKECIVDLVVTAQTDVGYQIITSHMSVENCKNAKKSSFIFEELEFLISIEGYMGVDGTVLCLRLITNRRTHEWAGCPTRHEEKKEFSLTYDGSKRHREIVGLSGFLEAGRLRQLNALFRSGSNTWMKKNDETILQYINFVCCSLYVLKPKAFLNFCQARQKFGNVFGVKQLGLHPQLVSCLEDKITEVDQFYDWLQWLSGCYPGLIDRKVPITYEAVTGIKNQIEEDFQKFQQIVQNQFPQGNSDKLGVNNLVIQNQTQQQNGTAQVDGITRQKIQSGRFDVDNFSITEQQIGKKDIDWDRVLLNSELQFRRELDRLNSVCFRQLNQRYQTASRNWCEESKWLQREIDAQQQLRHQIQQRMETNHHNNQTQLHQQIHWHHQVQLQISKSSHDRKILTEQNMELHQRNCLLEQQLQNRQRQLNAKCRDFLELEAQFQLFKNEISKSQQQQNSHQDIFDKEIYHQQHTNQVNPFLQSKVKELVSKIDSLTVENSRLQAQVASSTSVLDNLNATKNETEKKIASTSVELEKAFKQKEQSVYNLKSMLEKQQILAEEKLKAVNDKYQHIKAINIALQKRLIATIKDTEQKRVEDKKKKFRQAK